MSITVSDITTAIAQVAPLSLQESWDNSGLQVGSRDATCTGVLLCVDPTEAIVEEAVRRGCNLVVSHHPLLFCGLKHICGDSQVERTVAAAIRNGVAVYSSHTALDSARGGVSAEMARRLGAMVIGPLSPSAPGADTGLGVVAELPEEMRSTEFVELVKRAFGDHPFRCTAPSVQPIRRIALCGGAGGEFIPAAIAAGAQAYITADVRYHDFVDYRTDIFILDIGHFESEACAKDIFYHIIKEKYPTFAVYDSEIEKNPINYL